MKISELLEHLGKWAPLHTAEDWDNVGLLCGDRDAEVKTVIGCVDYTEAVAEEGRRELADVVLAYHPPIFAALKRVPFQSPIGRALRDGVAIYSPHTALDAAAGGTNDVLADGCGLGARAPLRQGERAELKLVTFVPEAAVERVSTALFSAGAGRIGDYSSCSFRSPGTGTFFGEAGSQPVVGTAGRLETVNELRLETVVPVQRLESVLAALRASHPYQTPAFDLVKLQPLPSGVGQGRVGDLATAATLGEVVARLKQHTGVAHVLMAGATADRVRRVAVAAGAGGELLVDAMSAKADVFVTGEIRHHDALRALSRGVRVLALLHSNSERRAVAALCERVAALGIRCLMSATDRDPFTIV